MVLLILRLKLRVSRAFHGGESFLLTPYLPLEEASYFPFFFFFFFDFFSFVSRLTQKLLLLQFSVAIKLKKSLSLKDSFDLIIWLAAN